MNVGIIINPKARKAKGKGLTLRNKLTGYHYIRSEVLDNFAKLPDIIKDFANNDIELIVISGGDGTLQAVQTELVEGKYFPILPRLSILPHGTTNMNAKDIGFQKSINKFSEIIHRQDYLRRATNIKKRHTIRVVNPEGRKALHGMFFGMGALKEGIEYCQSNIHKYGLKDNMAVAATLLSAIIKNTFKGKKSIEDGENEEASSNEIVKPYNISVSSDGTEKIVGEQLLFMLTTLDKVAMNSNPFWNVDKGSLKATSVIHPTPSVLRNIYSFMYGNNNRKLAEPDFVSFSSDKLAITSGLPFALDGEFYQSPQDKPLQITSGAEFEYLCG